MVNRHPLIPQPPPSPEHFAGHRLYLLAFNIWILNGMNWPSFTVEVSGIATLIYTDRLLAEMFQSVSCTYHALPIWGG